MITIQSTGILPSIKNTICTNKNKVSAHHILQKAGSPPEIQKKPFSTLAIPKLNPIAPATSPLVKMSSKDNITPQSC